MAQSSVGGGDASSVVTSIAQTSVASIAVAKTVGGSVRVAVGAVEQSRVSLGLSLSISRPE